MKYPQPPHAIISGVTGQPLTSPKPEVKLKDLTPEEAQEAFLDLSDHVAKQLEKRGYVARSCTYVVARPAQADISKGKIYKGKEAELETKMAGYARVVAVPNNVGNDSTYNDIKVGDLVFTKAQSLEGIHELSAAYMTGIPDITGRFLFKIIDSEITGSMPDPRRAASQTESPNS